MAFKATWLTLFASGASVLCSIILPLVAQAKNLVPNPGFELGNIGFTSAYRYQSDLFPSATYFIGVDPASHNPNWTNGTRPHSGHEMMIVNGAEQPDVEVWSTKGLPVRPNTTYFFSFYIASVHPSSPAILRFSVNKQTIGKDFSPSNVVGAWVQACVPWFSGTATSAAIAIVNENTTYYGNDFALDDISFDEDQACQSEPLVKRDLRYAGAMTRHG